MCNVKILICQIIAARKTDSAINDRDLTVISVIHKNIQNRHHRIEDPAVNAMRLHLLDKFRTDKSDTAHVIIHDADLHAFLCLCKQYRFHFRKCFPVLYGMVFHKDELLRLLHLFDLRMKSISCFFIKNNICILIQRIAYLMPDVIALMISSHILHFQLLHSRIIFSQIHAQPFPCSMKTLPHSFCGTGMTAEQIQADTHDGEQQDQHDPRHFHARIHFSSVNMQHQYK